MLIRQCWVDQAMLSWSGNAELIRQCWADQTVLSWSGNAELIRQCWADQAVLINAHPAVLSWSGSAELIRQWWTDQAVLINDQAMLIWSEMLSWSGRTELIRQCWADQAVQSWSGSTDQAVLLFAFHPKVSEKSLQLHTETFNQWFVANHWFQVLVILPLKSYIFL